jgi:hypothetical protein
MRVIVTPFPMTYRKRRSRTKSAPVPVIVPGPVLIAAGFVNETLTITFDRNVTVGSFEPSRFVINDPASGSTWTPISEPNIVSPTTMEMACEAGGPSVGNVLSFTATRPTEIVADDGTMWAGCTNLKLPLNSMTTRG